jgi:hypothetical protein
MTTISGAQFLRFVQWSSIYNTSRPVYQLWRVLENWTSDEAFALAQTCDTYAWDAWEALAQMGAVFNSNLEASHDSINLYSLQPIPVDTSNATEWAEVR